MYDLVIRGGTVVDGTGVSPRKADVAIEGDRVVAVGSDVGSGRREVDATGHVVAPGWVDVHTHYDGQVTWDPHLTPSGWNGVTTIVMGNCGVGFAPVRRGEEEFLIQLMEGVEDIPGTALHEGIDWEWESFPEYLDKLESMPRSVDVGTQVPHGAIRAYVMGERGAKNEKATTEEVAEMARLVKEGLEAGALGFSTSRTMVHRAKDGEVVRVRTRMRTRSSRSVARSEKLATVSSRSPATSRRRARNSTGCRGSVRKPGAPSPLRVSRIRGTRTSGSA